MSPDRVEFLDAPAAGGDDGDLVEVGGAGRGPRHATLWLAAAVVVVLAAALLVGRAVGGGDPAPTPSASASHRVLGRPTPPVTRPVFGLIGLPRAISVPRELVAADRGGDVVWMLDRGAGVVRIENGVVTAVQLLESQATALAVSPDGSRLYVATAANRPSIQAMDATTLALGPSRALDGSIQAMTVSIDAVWAASGSRLYRLDTRSLDTLDTLALPGAVLTDHLRIQQEQGASNQEYVVGLVTGGNDDGSTTSRFVRVDPLTRAVEFGPPLPKVSTVATGQYLTWVTTSDPAPRTEGYASVLDPTPTATAMPGLAAGSRIYDGGGGYAAFLVVAPDSSVIGCRDAGGFGVSEVDVAPALPGATVTGQVLRTDTSFYVVTDRGLVRSGVGACQ